MREEKRFVRQQYQLGNTCNHTNKLKLKKKTRRNINMPIRKLLFVSRKYN